MRFLVDAQLPPALARFLEANGHESKAVREISLHEAEDTTIWKCNLADHAITFRVIGPATYEHFLPARRDSAPATV
jgi:Domain of unknown function (DUF5615)